MQVHIAKHATAYPMPRPRRRDGPTMGSHVTLARSYERFAELVL